MTKEEHKQIHIELHKSFDQLLADYFRHNSDKFLVDTSILDLGRWAYEQTKNPTELEVA